MQSEEPATIYDRILKAVSGNDSIKFSELSEQINDIDLVPSIYKLIYLKLLNSNRYEVTTDEFHLSEDVDNMVRQGLTFEEIVERIRNRKRESIFQLVFPLTIVFLPLIILSLFFGFNNNTMVAGMITSVSIAIFIFSIGSIYSIALKSLSCLILIHLLVFPAVYTAMLREDPSSFSIDGDVKVLASRSAREDAIRKFDPVTSIFAINLIVRMFNSKSSTLNNDTRKLENFNIVKIDTFLLYKSVMYLLPDTYDENAGASLNICNSNGDLLVKIHGVERLSNNLDTKAETLKGLLENKLIQLKGQIKNYSIDNIAIKENRFWTYLRVLPHALNIFDVGNIVPKNDLANFLYMLHKALFLGLIALVALTDAIKENIQRFFDRRRE
jgi:hypothetical protein